MIKYVKYIFILILVVLYSCEKNDSSLGIELGPAGSFTYQSYDSLGKLIVNGWLEFELIDSVKIEGTWRLNNIRNRDDIGPQYGYGKLLGSISDSEIWMELNPQYVDNNMYLEGIKSDNYIEGKWYWISFPGVTNWGTFKASKN